MGAREVAVRWADALDGVVAPTLTRDRIEDLLTDLAADLLAAVRGSNGTAASSGQDGTVASSGSDRTVASSGQDGTAASSGSDGTDYTAVARRTAAALVRANYRDPIAVGRTIGVICGEVVADIRSEQPRGTAAHADEEYAGPLRERALALAAEFAVAFTYYLRRVALSEQEATLAATLVAAQQAEARRQLSEARFAAVFAGASVGIGTVDITGHVLDVNAAMARMLGIPQDYMPGRLVAELLGPANIGRAFSQLEQLLAGQIEQFRLETDHLRPDGGMASIDLSMSAVRDADGEVRFLIGIAVDVTERKQLADRLWHDANHDSLTGLPNRGLFFDRLANAVPPVGVCYLDLDGFKEINDVWGHAVGDRVLRVVAERLRAAVDPYTGLVARLGGDEFIVLIEKCSGPDQLTAIADELCAAIAPPMAVSSVLVAVGASIGTTYVTDRPTAVDELLHAVDTAMYRDKSRHRNRPR
ncbi:sensor domain-containing diguanylate cyclase [Nocardia panacis]|uniref:Sensor domain-containing diguanylate cyclase n=1 Tax=Nocardia panacis TaxID=2340916 RepID=A0A3A4KII4_9NOCA|nr:sensor domain-containing diguanylate cyclase [Nocardia panacis]